MSQSSSPQFLHFDLCSQKFLLQFLFPFQPLSLLLKVHRNLLVIGQHQLVLLLGQVQRSKSVRLAVTVDVVGVEVVMQGQRRVGKGNVDRGGGWRQGRLVIMDAGQVLLHFLLMASVQLWSSVCGKDREVWRRLNVLFWVQLDHLMGDP